MSIETKDFGDYSVKNVKSFMGMDALGFNCNLYRGKKKIAFCIDDGNGGMLHIDWMHSKLPKTENEYPNKKAYDKAWDEWKKLKAEEEKLLLKHVKKLPKVKSSFGGKEEMELTIDMDWFITDLVSKWEQDAEERKIQRQCKSKTLFRLKGDKEGEHWVLKNTFDDRVRKALNDKYGDKLEEIINDRFK